MLEGGLAEPLDKKILGLTLTLQLIILLLFLFFSEKALLILLFGIGGIIFIFAYRDPLIAFFILTCFISIILPKPTERAFLFRIEQIAPVLALFIFIIYYLQGDYAKRPVGKIGKYLVIFLIAVAISTVIGLAKGRPKTSIGGEILMFFAWGLYFIVVKSNLSQRQIKEILLTIIIGAAIVSFFYIFQFYTLQGVTRFRTDQQHILNFSIPFLFAVFLYDNQKWRRTLAILLIIPMTIAVYVTLTRTLWLLVPLAIILQYLYFIKDSDRQKKLYTYLLPLMIIVIIAVLGLYLLNITGGAASILGGRFASFKILEYDLSLLQRAEIAQYLTPRVIREPFFGTGLGDYVQYQFLYALREKHYWIDNTYLQLLWKTGIVGTILFLTFLIFFLRRAWFILKNGTRALDKIIGSCIFFSILTLMISSLQCGILIGYRFNYIWAVLMGITEVKAQEIAAQVYDRK